MTCVNENGGECAVLIYGQDALLLETRCLVLESAGFKVCAATELDEVLRLLAERQIAVLVLCHTLPAEKCHIILASARERRQSLKVLVLTGNDADCAAEEGDAVLEGFATARGLIASIQAMAGSRTQSARS